jgi:hypothetical protein
MKHDLLFVVPFLGHNTRRGYEGMIFVEEGTRGVTISTTLY